MPVHENPYDATLRKLGVPARPGEPPPELTEAQLERARREAPVTEEQLQLASPDLIQPAEQVSEEDRAALVGVLADKADVSPEVKQRLKEAVAEEGEEGYLSMLADILGKVGQGAGKVSQGFGRGVLGAAKGLDKILPSLSGVAVKSPWGHAKWTAGEEKPWSSKQMEKNTEQAANTGKSGPGWETGNNLSKTYNKNSKPDANVPTVDMSKQISTSQAAGLAQRAAAAERERQRQRQPEQPQETPKTPRTPRTPRTPEQLERGAAARAAEQYRIATGGAPRSAQEGKIQLEMTPQGLMRKVGGKLVPFDLEAHYPQTPARQR